MLSRTQDTVAYRGDLGDCRSFEAASLVLVKRLIVELGAEVSFEPLRVLVHRRPVHLGQGYDALAHVPLPLQDALRPYPSPEKLRPSTTVWSQISHTGRPALLRLSPRRFLSLNTEDTDVSADASSSIQERLSPRVRTTTHICGLPLRGSEGSIEGMVSLEVRSGSDDRATWVARVPGLQRAVDLASPALLALPPEPRPLDELLPYPVQPSPPMIYVLRMLANAARDPDTLLLTGPTGVGKTWLAQACHGHGDWAKGPFCEASVLGTPEALRLSELFGVRGGVATDVKERRGLLAEAEGGTLFFDDVDKLPLEVQKALLEVTDRRAYRRIGENTYRPLKARLAFATAVDLLDRVRQGSFLPDLYHRINQINVYVPSLERRKEEIPQWATCFLQEFDQADRRRSVWMQGSLELLSVQTWPGNLRDLRAVVKAARRSALYDRSPGLAEIAIEERHVREVLENGSRESAGASEVEEALQGLARAVLNVERERTAAGEPTQDLLKVCEGALRAVLIEEACLEEPLPPTFQRLVESRNLPRVRKEAQAQLEVLRGWIAAIRGPKGGSSSGRR